MTRRTASLALRILLITVASFAMTTAGAAVAPPPASGAITGTITNASTSTPLAGITVELYTTAGALAGITSTSGTGTFVLGGLPTGSYLARTRVSETQNYVDEIYNNLPCPPCDSGTVINVTDTVTTSGIDFALEPGGTVTGSVVTAGSGTPIPSMTVVISTVTGATVKKVVSDGSGAFVATGLPAGSYYARTSAAITQNYLDELYQELPCFPSCVAGAGTPISVAVGSTTGGIAFTLSIGASITGTVTAAANGLPIGAISVGAYTATGVFVGSALTNSAGTYAITRLAAGSYFARTEFNGQNYETELFNNLPCVGCSVTSGVAIAVAGSATTGGIDFSLTPGGTLTGTITSAANGALLRDVAVHVYAPNGVFVTRVHTTIAGTFTATGLSTSSYFVRTENVDGYVDELYADLPCVAGCTVTAGAATNVTAGSTTGGVDFALTPGGRIAGHVTNTANNAALAGITVGVYTASGRLVSRAITDGTGSYLTPTGLMTGTYYARTFNSAGYLNEIYNNLLFCFPSCLVTSGTAIAVTAGVTANGVDFGLAAGNELIQNGDFSNGIAHWSLFATPDTSYLHWQMPDSAFQFYRAPPPAGTSNSAVILQSTGTPLSAGAAMLAEFDMANTSNVRKRISVLVHDSDFSDLSVCTFWLAPNAPRLRYGMQTHTTKGWIGATISFYAASVGADGGFYELDNVSLQAPAVAPAARTSCLDPTVPEPPGGPSGPELLANGDFTTGTVTAWSLFGQIVQHVSAGVFEFYRPPPPDPAGVIFQPTGTVRGAGEILTAQFDLGNSSTVRKRVTVLLHDSDFSDLSACTFWLAPSQPLGTYTMRSFTTRSWTNATISVYAATTGPETWIRLDNVGFRHTPGTATTGTLCIAPGG